MLFLLFRLGEDRYALDATQVAEVVPMVDIKLVPQGPPGLAGLINYRGRATPVFDLSVLMLGRPAQRRLSTRIILLRYVRDEEDAHLLGLIAENVTETMRRESSDFVTSGIRHDGAPYLGPVCTDDRGLLQRGMIQWVDMNRLLSADVHDVLFPRQVAS